MTGSVLVGECGGGGLVAGGRVETIVPAKKGYSFYRMPNLHFASGLENSIDASNRCATVVNGNELCPRQTAPRSMFPCNPSDSENGGNIYVPCTHLAN